MPWLRWPRSFALAELSSAKASYSSSDALFKPVFVIILVQISSAVLIAFGKKKAESL